MEAQAVGLDDQIESRPVEVDAAAVEEPLRLRPRKAGAARDASEALLEHRVRHDEGVAVEQSPDRARPPARGFAEVIQVDEVAVDSLVDDALELKLVELARQVNNGADRAGCRDAVLHSDVERSPPMNRD